MVGNLQLRLALPQASIAVTGTNARDFTSGDACPSSLAPGDNCTLAVCFGGFGDYQIGGTQHPWRSA
jgi:hypothetical protein